MDASTVTEASTDDGRVPVDLQEPTPPAWDVLSVPEDWDTIAAIAREVADSIPPLVTAITRCIGEEIPAYASGTVPMQDLRASVERNLLALLRGLAEHRGPRADEVSVRRELGVRRALQGLPVDALIQAYHVGYRELWLALADAASRRGQPAQAQLLTAATTVWQWVHEVTNALAAAHAATVRSLEAQVAGARQRFVELLAAGDLDGAETRRLAGSLGFDADTAFVVSTVRGCADAAVVVDLQRELDQSPGQHAVAARGQLLVVVGQDTDPEAVVAACRHVLPDAAIGVGIPRTGLRGARASLEDAEQTVAVTEPEHTGRFEDVWLWATLSAGNERLRPLLEPGAAAAVEHPHLAEAVEAFAEAGFSVTEASRRLGLHANTVAYRLERWQALTGWEPRAFPGLARSLASLRLAR